LKFEEIAGKVNEAKRKKLNKLILIGAALGVVILVGYLAATTLF